MLRVFVIYTLCILGLFFAPSNVKADEFDVSHLNSHQKDCENKIAKSCFYIGIAYFMGNGYAKNDVKAYQYLEKAHKIEPKNTLFISTIARMEYYKYKIDNNDVTKLNNAINLFIQACNLKDTQSCNVLGDIYWIGESDIDVNLDKSRAYYQKSCDLRDKEGCEKLKVSKKR